MITEQMQGLTAPEKAEFLRTNATSIKEGSYFKRFIEEDISERKDTLVESVMDDIKKTEGFNLPVIIK